MSLTEAGALYYDRIVHVIDELDEADGTLQSMQEQPSGVLRVSAPVTVTLVALSAAIPNFLDRYPGISLDLRLDDRRVDIVREGFDLALRGSDKLEDSRLIAKKLATMDHVLCGAPSYFEKAPAPEHPGQVASHSCIQFTLSDHADEWTFTRADQSIRVPIKGRYRVSSSLAVRDALLAGFGLSLIPRMYVRDELGDGRLVPVLEDWSLNTTTLYAVYPSRRFVTSKMRVMLEFLATELGKQ